jgi:hypothetical protein
MGEQQDKRPVDGAKGGSAQVTGFDGAKGGTAQVTGFDGAKGGTAQPTAEEAKGKR